MAWQAIALEAGSRCIGMHTRKFVQYHEEESVRIRMVRMEGYSGWKDTQDGRILRMEGYSGWKDTQDGRILRMGKRPNVEDAIASRQLIVSCIIFFILFILKS
jgi:hypothetical protein